MLRRIPRLLRLSVVIAALLAVSASVYQSWSAGQPGLGVTQTEFGPLSAADRDLLVKVRLAGLWEGPSGQQAERQASSADVQEVGRKLALEHAELDEAVRNTADQLGVLLPSSPNSTQVAWMAQISSQTGTDYDRTFVQIVRAAHGQILPLISDVRASTRNTKMREFAEVGNEFVTRHHQYLESTGLVDYAALPTTQLTPLNALTSTTNGPQQLIMPIVVFVAVVLGAVALLGALRKKSATRAPRVTVPTSRVPAAAAMAAAPAMAAIAAPVAAIPGPRTVSEPTAHWTPADAGPPMAMDSEPRPATLSDSGTYRTVSDPGGTYRAAPDVDSYPPAPPARPYRTDAGPYRDAAYESDSGPYRTVADTGPYRGAAPEPDSGPYRAVSDTGPRRAYRTISETGSHRPGYDTGFQRTESDTGSQRATPDPGSHRASARSGPRHSVRR